MKHTIEIIGYHVCGYEDDHFSGADREAYLSLYRLVQEAGGESVDWAVLEAHRRKVAGIELDAFEECLNTPLPAVKRYRLTLEILEPEQP